jgi:hypothetical protein
LVLQELELALLQAEADKKLLMLEISQVKKMREMDVKREQQERKRLLREAKVCVCAGGGGRGRRGAQAP